jgi:chaperonin GroES
VKAVGKKVIVEIVHLPPRSKGGIVIPDFDKKLEQEGVVQSVGSEVENLKAGDRVIVDLYNGIRLPKDPEKKTKTYIAYVEEDIIARVVE